MPDNFIWTKHVEERSTQRGISANEVWSTLKYPERQEKTTDNKYKFQKDFGGKKIVIVATQQNGKWVVLTTWIKDKEATRQYWASKPKRKGPWLQRLVSDWLFGRRGK